MIDPNATPIEIRDVIFPYRQYMLTETQKYKKPISMTPEQCDAAKALAATAHDSRPIFGCP